VAQSQVLDGELAVAAEEEGEKPKQVEQESDHRVGIVSGSGPIDQPVGQRNWVAMSRSASRVTSWCSR
jgi:hypothetical protein